MTTAPNSAILDPVTNPALTVAPQSKETDVYKRQGHDSALGLPELLPG